jgi:hypothetical protein
MKLTKKKGARPLAWLLFLYRVIGVLSGRRWFTFGSLFGGLKGPRSLEGWGFLRGRKLDY